MHLTTNLPFLKFPEAIPEELRHLPNWVAWRYQTRDGKDTKIPYSPHGGMGKADRPETWGTFNQAVETALRGRMSGIGFQFGGTDLTGVDLDWKTYTGDDIPPEAVTIIEALDSYSELTPSGKGAHIILRGKLPPGTRKRVKLCDCVEMEVYSEGRFFTVTGDVLHTPLVEDRQKALEGLAGEHLGRDSTPRTAQPSGAVLTQFRGSDNELWERIFTSASGEQVRALADGDLSRYDGDRSRADFAMCGHLAFWCNGDAARMDTMFRQTALIRPKWDEQRGTNTYGELTIQEVLNRWDGQGYDPTRWQGQRAETQVEWNAPEALLRGRQHLASSGSHGRTVDSYSALWQAVVGVVAEGHTVRQDDTLTVTSYGMTEIYARAGGRLVDRRQQLKFLHAQGMCGPLVRQDPDNLRSAWLLTLPADPASLPMWLARGSLQSLPVNSRPFGQAPRGQLRDTYSPVNKDYGRESNNRNSASKNLPFWTLFSLSLLWEGNTAEVCDLSGISDQMVRRHLRSLPTLVERVGGRRWQRWRSVLTPQQVGELYLHLTAPDVERRKRKMLEARLEFHEDKFRYLTSRGLHERAALHFRYAERYRERLEEAA